MTAQGLDYGAPPSSTDTTAASYYLVPVGFIGRPTGLGPMDRPEIDRQSLDDSSLGHRTSGDESDLGQDVASAATRRGAGTRSLGSPRALLIASDPPSSSNKALASS